MSKKIQVHFSSASNEWATPWELFNRISALWGPFDLDPCCTDKTHKCDTYMTQEDDALTQSWDIASEKGTRVFMNPPYGREIGKWVKKAFEESLKGTLVVCLIPSRTDTKWWHAYCMKASHIIFLRGRVKFEQNGKTGTVSAPFPSCLVIFRGRDEDNLDNPPVIGSMGA